MDPAALAILAGTIKAASSLQQGWAGSVAIDAQTKEYRLNSQQERWAAEQAYQEGAMAVNQATDSAVKNIATGVAAMSASGNIGSSAQAALLQAYFNLDKDIGALNFKYNNEAIQHKNKAKMYDYNSKISEANRKNRIISSYLGAANAFMGGAAQGAYYSGAGAA